MALRTKGGTGCAGPCGRHRACVRTRTWGGGTHTVCDGGSSPCVKGCGTPNLISEVKPGLIPGGTEVSCHTNHMQAGYIAAPSALYKERPHGA